MNFGTLAVLLLLAVIVGAIIFKMHKDKKKGKHICGGDCGSCHGCSHGMGRK